MLNSSKLASAILSIDLYFLHNPFADFVPICLIPSAVSSLNKSLFLLAFICE